MTQSPAANSRSQAAPIELPRAVSSPCGRPLLYAAENLSLYHGREQPKQGEAHSHDDIQIVLPISGTFHAAWKAVGGQQRRQTVSPGMISLSASQQPHTIRVERETELAVVWLPSVILAQTAGELQAGSPEIADSGTASDPLLGHLCLALLAEVRQNPTPARLYVDSAANLLAAQLIRRHASRLEGTAEITGGLSARRLQLALSYIQENLPQDISLAALAEASGLSPSHFSLLFRQSVGLSPYQYVLNQRIERAKALLSAGGLSVGEIALQVGFCDQSQFTRQFKQQVGLTPRAFVKASS